VGSDSCSGRRPHPCRWGRAGHLAKEDCHLVTEHDDLDGQIVGVTTTETQQLQGPDEGEV